MTQFFRSSLAFAFIALSAALAWGGALREGGALHGYAGGHGEPTFGQLYGVNLPISSCKLEAFLKAHGLEFRISAEKGSSANVIPTPVWTSDADIRPINKVYDIYDPSKSTKGKAVHYFAYADGTGSIIYIENRYQYDGP